ncbi:amino acid ABC transporter permease [Paludibacterium sp.]|uniref:amino acid ABC transporter permease n=1 Tax=Paludibacterium sp. TaxID=1917523 RepID=UPI0025E0B5E3|nr:amino acid ABC transporter permease [Paludibacterium sp.]MBV8648672.1 amino acid ABC transporter permease [Paludibacterium sp.]
MAVERFHFQVIIDNAHYLLVGNLAQGQIGGVLLTLLIALSSGLLALIIGFVLALLCRFFPRRLAPALGTLGELVRGIPLLLLIFWLYFLLPMLLGRGAPDTISVIAALALFNAFSVMLTILSGLAALPPGQNEAAMASGFTHWQRLRWVLLPQALSHILPSLVNLFVALIKDTSLAFVVSVPELTLVSSQINNREQIYPLEIFLTAGAIYFALCSSLTWAAHQLENRLARRQLSIV